MDQSSARPVVLALRALDLGQLLVAVPALRGLRRAFPSHELVLAAPAGLAPVVPLIGGINRLLGTPDVEGPLRWRGPVDIAVDLHGHGPKSRTRLEELSPTYRIGHAAPGWAGPEWDDEFPGRERWARLMSWHGIEASPDDLGLCPPEAPAPVEAATVLHVGAAPGGRQWPVERFADVAAVLALKGHRVVVAGDAKDAFRAAAVVRGAGLPRSSCVAGTWDLVDLVAAVAAARVVITADSSASQLANAYRTPSVVLFDQSTRQEWNSPPDGPHIALAEGQTRPGVPFPETLEPGSLAVLPGTVLDAVDRLEILGLGRAHDAADHHREYLAVR
ncbi:glycosyltransferase family 9 protein [Sinomonas cyclohexanicum]|uniref:glycosyltransferase family 9 protein n=1 Tax=Sinomonas cyclohexanicum TaxID=322009 RepID=UPI001E5AE1E2|nr:glycosyltransferase family 9 protein [Corynebacterium cyclohexanicum]